MKNIILVILLIVNNLNLFSQELDIDYDFSQSEINWSDPDYTEFFNSCPISHTKSAVTVRTSLYKTYYQNNSIWKSSGYGTVNCLNKQNNRKTIGSTGCYLTCIAMCITDVLQDASKTPLWLQGLMNPNYFDVCDVKRMTTFDFSDKKLKIIEGEHIDAINFANIKAVLDDGDYVMLATNYASCHKILVYSYINTGTTASDFLIADPLDWTVFSKPQKTKLSDYDNKAEVYFGQNVTLKMLADKGNNFYKIRHNDPNSIQVKTGITNTSAKKGDKVHYIPMISLGISPQLKSTVSYCNILWVITAPNGTKTTFKTEEIDYTFDQVGTYKISVAAINSSGYNADLTSVVVSEPPPTELKADFTASTYSGATPLKVDFTSTVSGGTSPYTYSWNFGDNTLPSTTEKVSHTFSTAKTFTISLTVTDANKVVKSVSHTVTAVTQDALYDAAFTMSPSSGKAPLLVTFTGASTGNPTSWYWEFGDGSVDYTQNPSYTYNNKGLYNVKLTVTFSDGSKEIVSKSLTVREPSGNVNIGIDVANTKLDGNGKVTTTFTATAARSLINPNWHWYIQTSPNTVSQNMAYKPHSSNTSTNTDVTTYSYNTEGSYNVQVSVIDDDLNTGNASITFSIGNSNSKAIYPSIVIEGNYPNNDCYYVAKNSRMRFNGYAIFCDDGSNISYNCLSRFKWTSPYPEKIIDWAWAQGQAACNFYEVVFSKLGINDINLTTYAIPTYSQLGSRNSCTGVNGLTDYYNSVTKRVFVVDVNETKRFTKGETINPTGIIIFEKDPSHDPTIKSTESKSFEVYNYASLKNGFHAEYGSNLRISTNRVYTYNDGITQKACPPISSYKSVEDSSNLSSINIMGGTKPVLYPNPTTGNLTITQPTEKANMQIINMYGIVVQSQLLTGTTNQINISQLASGVYTVKLVSAAGVWQTQIIKN